MSQPGKSPAEAARDCIEQALEAVQEDPALQAELDRLVTALAKAQQKLFQASSLKPGDTQGTTAIRGAMEYLARGLQLLQDVRSPTKATSVAAEQIARSLAVLYPVSRRRESEVPPPAPAGRPAPPQQQGLDRRGTIRLEITTQLGLQSDTHFYTGFSENISEGGIFVATFDLKPIGTRVLVSFRLPDDHQVTARGEVRWIREFHPDDATQVPGMGVKFSQLLDEDRVAIERYLAQRAPLFYDE